LEAVWAIIFGAELNVNSNANKRVIEIRCTIVMTNLFKELHFE